MLTLCGYHAQYFFQGEMDRVLFYYPNQGTLLKGKPQYN
jgi:hypothetical protein